MNKISMPARPTVWWLVPLVALVATFGWETDWGSTIEKSPQPAAAPIESKPVATALLPEYEIPGGIGARTETVERTLFNPTRRPAPQAAQDGSGPSQMKRGQFALTGTMLVEGKSTAFLREVAGNKSRHVRAGETINGMRVAEVKPDRVLLTLGDESEEVVLKVATNPRPTPQPVIAAAQPQSAPVTAARPAPAAPNAAAAAVPQGGAQTAIERRRAARAAAAAAAAAGGQQPAADGSNPWDRINQQYQQRAAGRQNQK